MSKRVKMRWARKLMRSKYFVLLTNTDAVISLKGANPENMDDIMVLTLQAAELRDFHKMLGDLIERHEAKIRKILAPTEPKAKRRKKAKKIEVKEA